MAIDAPAAVSEVMVSEADDLLAPVRLSLPTEVDEPALDADSADDARVGPESIPLLERIFLRKLRKGDPRAFRELVRRHQDRVFSMNLRMLGDRHEAEDVSQEVFVAVHRHLPRFRGECKLSTWIYRVARNHCLNRLKYNERRESGGEADLDRLDAAEHPGLSTPPERPDRALLGAEERTQVQRALQRLSAEHRLIVILRDIEGMSYEDIGRIAELPPGTVKSRLHRARSALADELEKAGMAPDGARETP